MRHNRPVAPHMKSVAFWQCSYRTVRVLFHCLICHPLIQDSGQRQLRCTCQERSLRQVVNYSVLIYFSLISQLWSAPLQKQPSSKVTGTIIEHVHHSPLDRHSAIKDLTSSLQLKELHTFCLPETAHPPRYETDVQ